MPRTRSFDRSNPHLAKGMGNMWKLKKDLNVMQIETAKMRSAFWLVSECSIVSMHPDSVVLKNADNAGNVNAANYGCDADADTGN